MENDRNKQDLATVFNHQDNIFDNKNLRIFDIFTVNKNPFVNNGVSNKNFVDDELDQDTILSFNQTLQNYIKVSGENTA